MTSTSLRAKKGPDNDTAGHSENKMDREGKNRRQNGVVSMIINKLSQCFVCVLTLCVCERTREGGRQGLWGKKHDAEKWQFN